MVSDKPVGKVISEIGMGRAQVKSILLGGGVVLADGAELLLISSVASMVAKDWDLSGMQKSSLVMFVYVGLLLGNAVSGVASDNYGRRPAILFSYVGVYVFSLVSSLSVNFLMLALVRLFTGIMIGIGIPSMTCLQAEVCPPQYRTQMTVMAQCMFSVGEMFSATLIYIDDPSMDNLHWRGLLFVGAMPSLVLGCLAALFLNESPLYLAVQGQYDKAKNVLESMKRANKAHHVSVDFAPPEQTEQQFDWEFVKHQLSVALFPSRLYTTVAMSVACLYMNTAFYGSMYVYPQVLPQLHMGFSPSVELIVGGIVGVGGLGIGFFTCMFLDRIPAMSLVTAMSALFMLLFGICITISDNSIFMILLTNVSFYGTKLTTASLGLIYYQYLMEYFPTEARTTAAGLCMAFGRLGSVASPVLSEAMHAITGSWSSVFFVNWAIASCTAVLLAKLPTETKDRFLVDREDFLAHKDGKYGTLPPEIRA